MSNQRFWISSLDRVRRHRRAPQERARPREEPALERHVRRGNPKSLVSMFEVAPCRMKYSSCRDRLLR
jgi:hypothetical protein